MTESKTIMPLSDRIREMELRPTKYPGYFVSAAGRVYSFKRNKWMKPLLTHRGYHRVCLHLPDQRKTYVTVHRLIAEVFIGPRPDGLDINHIDGNKTNNTLSNLEYVTRRKNLEHSWAAGKKRQGENHGMSKLTERAVIEIRSSPLSTKDLAKKFGVCTRTILDVRRGFYWAHVEVLRGGEAAE